MADEVTTPEPEAKPAPVLPYDPEPQHITEKRDALKAANAELNEIYKTWESFAKVYGHDSEHTKEALKKVHAAQEKASAAAHDKSVAVLEHGVTKANERVEAARGNLSKALASRKPDEMGKHAQELDQALKSHADVEGRLAFRLSKAPKKEAK